MAAPAGLAGQLGFKSESTYGTGVTVDQFLPFVNENIQQNIARLESRGIRAGRRVQHAWKAGGKNVTGPMRVELPNINAATLLRHMFGTIATTGTGPYTHTASPGTLTGKSLTIQVGRPDIGGTVDPFTFAGCKFADWTLSARINELAYLDCAVIGATEVTATALASASYAATWSPFAWTEGSLTIAGSSVNVREMSLKGNNTLDGTRWRMGAAAIKEPLENGIRIYDGTLLADFEGLTAYNRFVNGTEAALVMAFTNGSSDSLTVTANVRFDGQSPVVASEAMLDQPLPFKCVSTTSDAAAITAVLVNGDTTST